MVLFESFPELDMRYSPIRDMVVWELLPWLTGPRLQTLNWVCISRLEEDTLVPTLGLGEPTSQTLVGTAKGTIC